MGGDMLLSGDIGGTNSRFVLFEVVCSDGLVSNPDAVVKNNRQSFEKSYKNEGYTQFSDVMKRFLADATAAGVLSASSQVVAGCLAVAGPVVKDCCNMTNIGWDMSGRRLESMFGIGRMRLVNDFVAAGYGTLTLAKNEVKVLQEGEEDLTKPIAVIGAGTGLGQVFMTPHSIDGLYEAFPSEGGHVEYAPRDQREFDLLEFTKKALGGRVSVERIVSGRGIVNVYEFLYARDEAAAAAKGEELSAAAKAVHAEVMAEVAEGGKIVGAHESDDARCAEAMEIMISAYGAETGNLGLKFMPFGGLYIAGGIVLKVLHHFKDGGAGEFMDAFRDKGRLSPELARVPLKIVLAPDLGIRGAHVVANREYYFGASSVPSGGAAVTAAPPTSSVPSLYFAVGCAAVAAGIYTYMSKK